MSQEFYRRKLRALQPGYAIDFDACEVDKSVLPNPGWTAGEWLLEGIVGAAYEYVLTENPERRTYHYERLATPTTGHFRASVSPDRRECFRQRPNGLYEFASDLQQRADALIANFKTIGEREFATALSDTLAAWRSGHATQAGLLSAIEHFARKFNP